MQIFKSNMLARIVHRFSSRSYLSAVCDCGHTKGHHLGHDRTSCPVMLSFHRIVKKDKKKSDWYCETVWVYVDCSILCRWYFVHWFSFVNVCPASSYCAVYLYWQQFNGRDSKEERINICGHAFCGLQKTEHIASQGLYFCPVNEDVLSSLLRTCSG